VSLLESENKSLRRQLDGSEGAKKQAINVSDSLVKHASRLQNCSSAQMQSMLYFLCCDL
jgi:hypothetical protein